MPLQLDEAFRILQICTYSEQDFFNIIAQFTEVEKMNFLSQTLFSVKEIGNEKLFQLNGRMQHKQWAEIHLEFLFSKPLESGIQVFVQNPNPNMIKFNQGYVQYQRDTLLDLTSEFQIKTFVEILKNLKVRFDNKYPYNQIKSPPIQQVVYPNIQPVVVAQQIPNVSNSTIDQTTQSLRKSMQFIIKAIQSDWERQKEIRAELVKSYNDVQIERANLQQLLNEIEENSNQIENETAVMNQFLSENADVQINEQNVLDTLMMVPSEQQICELLAEISAIKDSYKFLQQRFQRQNIPLEYLYQNVKYFADQEFNAQMLLKKCQQKLQLR